MGRTLVAGFGNVLRGDDGFGVEVIHSLQTDCSLGAGVELLEVGTGGIRLAQELLGGYDRLIVVDAMTRGGTPGTVYALEVESVAPTREIDLHLAIPSRALSVAQALGVLPPQVFLVGCEPGEVDEFGTELTPAVRIAVGAVIDQIRALIRLGAVRASPSGVQTKAIG
ncbi:MAG: hydrogenase maturation protease [Gemmatimonadales bacterium]